MTKILEVKSNVDKPRSRFGLLWLIVIYSFLLLAVFSDTAFSLVETWYRTGTYAHGFLILPISIWLVWEKRDLLASTPTHSNISVLILILPVSIIWLLANLVDVLVVQQFALVGLLVLGVWVLVGHAVARIIVFPLCFLFLGVPMGEDLVPPLMEFTASSTVRLIQMTGIPVYREGLYFSLPSGNWSVVEACSGVRYLIASFTLGLLYAYMTYRSLARRLVFVLAAIIVPIIANSVRAYGIVMLGHMSGMTIATGVDHLIYGWLFFGVVMMLLFWFGALWREETERVEDGVKREGPSGTLAVSQPGVKPVVVAVFAILVSSVGPVLVKSIGAADVLEVSSTMSVPEATGGWKLANEHAWTWRPVNSAGDREIVQFYQRDKHIVALYINQYFNQSQGAELEGGGRKFFDKELDWKISAQSIAPVMLQGERVEIDQVTMRNPQGRIEILSWYRIGPHHTANPYMVKLYELWERLRFSDQGSARIVLATNVADGVDPQDILQSFLVAHLAGIKESLDTKVADEQ